MIFVSLFPAWIVIKANLDAPPHPPLHAFNRMDASPPRPAVTAPSAWAGAARFAGPGLLVSVGYMDPGNWATDIEAGSRYGYALLFVVALSSLAALYLQTRAARLGLVSGRDLAQLCRERYSRPATLALWAGAEVAIVACDIAEVLGAALALKLLLHLPLWAGVLLTGLDTLIVLALQGRGMRRLEAAVLGLVATVAAAFVVELALFPPDWGAAARGLLPTGLVVQDRHALYLAIGIVGATVMPHNLYLHSALVRRASGEVERRAALKWTTIDVGAALAIAMLVNAAILLLAASAFRHATPPVTEIDQAYRLLTPLTGTGAAALLFGIALLASGQSSTITGTLAGQVILEGFLGMKLPLWQRRAITRALAILPALAGVLWLGDDSVGRLLVLTQVALSLQLPFAIWPMLRFTGDAKLMGEHADGGAARFVGWVLFSAITAANLWLLAGML